MKQRRYKVLVVDDTEATRYAVARTLLKSGFDIIEAANGFDALKLVESELPDLVTLDIHLPDILGFEVCRQIKKNPRTSYIPVLQVSASYVTSKDRIHGLEGGADSYLTHPFEPPVLVATVKALLRSRELVEDLRRSDEHFRVALKNAPIMIYTCDANLKINWIHNAPYGVDKEYLVGNTIHEMFDQLAAEDISQLKRRVLTDGSGLRAVKKVQIASEELSYDITIEPLTDSGGIISGLTVACIDVTERLKAELAIRKAMEQAELANQAKTRFLSNMSHEIRTPMGVIQGFADLALDDNSSPEERQNYLHTIKRNAAELTKLIGEILDLAKIESGHSKAESLRFSIHDLIQDVVSALSLQAKEKGITLSLNFKKPFPYYLTADPTRTRQILMNLISNAIKFTTRGGVKVTGYVIPQEDQKQSCVIFDIEDSGIGLAPEQSARLFQAFSQADNSTTRKFGGTGLGLDLSRRLANSMGGNVKLVESQIGVGSTFRFSVDAGVLSEADFRAEIKPKIEIKTSRFANRLSGLNVLLVDDSTDNQMLFSRYLKRAGAEVVVASDGIEAVEIGSKIKFDVILMDVQMPHMDGYQATAKIRSLNILTPIIAITANALKEERERALQSGFTDYLTKPLEPTTLVRTLEQYLKSSTVLTT